MTKVIDDQELILRSIYICSLRKIEYSTVYYKVQEPLKVKINKVKILSSLIHH